MMMIMLLMRRRHYYYHYHHTIIIVLAFSPPCAGLKKMIGPALPGGFQHHDVPGTRAGQSAGSIQWR